MHVRTHIIISFRRRRRTTFFLHLSLSFTHLRIVNKQLRNNQKENEIHSTNHRIKRIVIIQMRLVQIVQYPSVPTFLGVIGHRRQKKAAQEVPDPQTCRKIGRPEALHPLRGLIVEELDFRHLHEVIGHPHQRELREEDEDREGDDLALLGDPVLSSHAQPLPLGEGGGDHDDDVEEYAYAHPLKEGYASRVFGVLSEEGYEEAVVEYYGDEHEDCDEGAEGSRWDLEMGADAPLESRALLHEEGLCLWQEGARYECCYEDRDHLHHLFRLFDLSYRA